MYKKYIFLFLLIVELTNCSILNAQQINLTETKKNTIEKKFKNVLIIGAGSTATRLFLDNLTRNLIEALNKEKIEATYYYDGKLDRNTQIEFKNFVNEKYDGYIVFNLSDTSYVHTKNKTLPLSIPVSSAGGTAQINLNYSRLRYAENFLIEFFEYSNTKVSVWEATLKLNFDFSKEKFYYNITRILMKSFKQNQLL